MAQHANSAAGRNAATATATATAAAAAAAGGDAEGFLCKRGGALGLQWQRRHFRLDGTRGVLSWSTLSSSGGGVSGGGGGGGMRLEERGRIELRDLAAAPEPCPLPSFAGGDNGDPSSSVSSAAGAAAGGGDSVSSAADSGSGRLNAASGLPGARGAARLSATRHAATARADCFFDLRLRSTESGRVYHLLADTPPDARRWCALLGAAWRAALERDRLRGPPAGLLLQQAQPQQAQPQAQQAPQQQQVQVQAQAQTAAMMPLMPAPSAPPLMASGTYDADDGVVEEEEEEDDGVGSDSEEDRPGDGTGVAGWAAAAGAPLYPVRASGHGGGSVSNYQDFLDSAASSGGGGGPDDLPTAASAPLAPAAASAPPGEADGGGGGGVRSRLPSRDVTVSDDELRAMHFAEGSGLADHVEAMATCASLLSGSVLRDVPAVEKRVVDALIVLRMLDADNALAVERLPAGVRPLLASEGEHGSLGDRVYAAVTATQRAVLSRFPADGAMVVARLDAWLTRRAARRRDAVALGATSAATWGLLLFLLGDVESVCARTAVVLDMVQRRYLDEGAGAKPPADPSQHAARQSWHPAVAEAVAAAVVRAREVLAERPSYFYPELLCARLGYRSADGGSQMMVNFGGTPAPRTPGGGEEGGADGGDGADAAIRRPVRALLRCSLVFQQLQLENSARRALKGNIAVSRAVESAASAVMREFSPDHTALKASAAELARVAPATRALEMGIFAAWRQRDAGACLLLATEADDVADPTSVAATSSSSSSAVAAAEGGAAARTAAEAAEVLLAAADNNNDDDERGATATSGSVTPLPEDVARQVMLQKNSRVLIRLALTLPRAARDLQDALMLCAIACSKNLPKHDPSPDRHLLDDLLAELKA